MKQYIDPDPFTAPVVVDSKGNELDEIRTIAKQAMMGTTFSKAVMKQLERQCPKASKPVYKPRDKAKAKAAKASKRKNRNK